MPSADRAGRHRGPVARRGAAAPAAGVPAAAAAAGARTSRRRTRPEAKSAGRPGTGSIPCPVDSDSTCGKWPDHASFCYGPPRSAGGDRVATAALGAMNTGPGFAPTRRGITGPGHATPIRARRSTFDIRRFASPLRSNSSGRRPSWSCRRRAGPRVAAGSRFPWPPSRIGGRREVKLPARPIRPCSASRDCSSTSGATDQVRRPFGAFDSRPARTEKSNRSASS